MSQHPSRLARPALLLALWAMLVSPVRAAEWIYTVQSGDRKSVV